MQVKLPVTGERPLPRSRRKWTITLTKSRQNTSVKQRKLLRKRLRRGKLTEPVEEEGACVSHQLLPLSPPKIKIEHICRAERAVKEEVEAR